MFQSIITENQLDMPGWDAHLQRQLREHNLTHLSVSCFSPKRGAWTPGFEITERQIRDLERVYRRHVTPNGNCIDLAQYTYRLDKKGAKYGRNVLHACRTLSQEDEHVWMSFGGGYVVIGVSELDVSACDRCLNCVLALQMHIMESSPQRVTSQRAPRHDDDSSTGAAATAAAAAAPAMMTSRSFESQLPNIEETEMQAVPYASDSHLACATGSRLAYASDNHLAYATGSRLAYATDIRMPYTGDGAMLTFPHQNRTPRQNRPSTWHHQHRTIHFDDI